MPGTRPSTCSRGRSCTWRRSSACGSGKGVSGARARIPYALRRALADNAVMNADDISRRTLAHYDQTADAFFAGTIGHDVSQNIDALLQAIEAPAPWTILDLGCGPGRDLKTFSGLGHTAIGLDGSAR